MQAWLVQNRAALASAVRRLGGAPLGSALSLLVIAIALTLPALGWVLLDNLGKIGRDATGVQQISVFLDLSAGKNDIGEIEHRLRQAASAKWRFVPRDEALRRLQENEGMAEIVGSLPRNPLPDAFVVEPSNTDPQALEVLRKELAGWPKVSHVQLDSAWVKRFDAFLRLGRLVLWILAGVFGTGLVAATFNTIRLQVLAQAAEIEVARMIGATDGFIRRPFHFFGALQGGLGGLLAGGLVLGIVHLLSGPAAELGALYGSDFVLDGPGGSEFAILGGAGGLLGWVGARLSVSLSLRRFD